MTDGILLDGAQRIGLGGVFAQELLPLQIGDRLTAGKSQLQLFSHPAGSLAGHDRLAGSR